MDSGEKQSLQQVKFAAALQEELAGKILHLPDHAWDGFGLTFAMRKNGAHECFALLRDHPKFLCNMLLDITAVDWLDRRTQRFELVYQLLSLTHKHRLCIKIAVSEENPEAESVRALWASANFLEREVYDMFGIVFVGHGDLRRILLYDEFQGHPLRKDYPLKKKQPRIELRAPELENTSVKMRRSPLKVFSASNGISNSGFETE